MSKPTVPAESFMATIAANVDNPNLGDAQFREFIRNTLPIVEYPRPTDKDRPEAVPEEVDEPLL